MVKLEESGSLYPYMSSYKYPQWYPFSLKINIDRFYLPYKDAVVEYYRYVSERLATLNPDMEFLYYYVLLGVYLDEEIIIKHNADFIYDFILECRKQTDNGGLGFALTPGSERADLHSTAYAAVILKHLSRFRPSIRLYLDRIVGSLFKFIESCKHGNSFGHCPGGCKKCKEIPKLANLYRVLEIRLALRDRLDRTDFAYTRMLKKTVYPPVKNLYRLLCMKFFGMKENLREDELRYFLQFMKKDGGFSFDSSAETSDINDTFEITYVLENYSFILKSLDYKRGKVLGYLMGYLKTFKERTAGTPAIDEIRGYLIPISKSVILLSMLWNKVLDTLEDLIFETISRKDRDYVNIEEIRQVIDIRGFEGVVLDFINGRYKIKLRYVDNTEEFRKFKKEVDISEVRFVEQIYFGAMDGRIGISAIVDAYNKKHRDFKIREQYLIEFIKRMENRRFFRGGLRRKRTLLGKKYVYIVTEFIPAYITTDDTIDYARIRREKAEVEDFDTEIYNMINGIKEALVNIKNEVESLIYAEEIEYAKKRLEFDIKSTRQEAELFRSNIITRLESFEYINPEAFIGNRLEEWNRLYKGLKRSFRELTEVIEEKIKYYSELKNQKEKLKELEYKIAELSAELDSEFSVFEEEMRVYLKKVAEENGTPTIDVPRRLLGTLSDKIEDANREISRISVSIKSDDPKIRKRRKELIGEWKSRYSDFKEDLEYYLKGIEVWWSLKQKSDRIFGKYISKIRDIEKEVKKEIAMRNFEKAKKILDTGFSSVIKNPEKEVKGLTKELDKNLKNYKKLYPLFRSLENEIGRKLKEFVKNAEQTRKDLVKKIEMDRVNKIKEDLITAINTEINRLDDLINAFSVNIEKMISSRITPVKLLREQFDYVERELDKSLKKIDEGTNRYSSSINLKEGDIREYIERWKGYVRDFRTKFEKAKEDIIDNAVNYAILSIASEEGSNIIGLEKLAAALGIQKDELIRRISKLIDLSKISGKIKDNREFILFNAEYHKNIKLKIFIDGKLSELEEYINRLIAEFDREKKEGTLVKNHKTFTEFLKLAKERINGTESVIKRKIEEINPDRNNGMFRELYADYLHKLNEITSRFEDVAAGTGIVVKCAEIISSAVKEVENTIEPMKVNMEKIAEGNRANFKKNRQKLGQYSERIGKIIARKKKETVKKLESVLVRTDDKELKKTVLNYFNSVFGGLMKQIGEEHDKILKILRETEEARKKEILDRYFNNKIIPLAHLIGGMKEGVLYAKNESDTNVTFKKRIAVLREKRRKIEKQIRNIEKNIDKKNKKEMQETLPEIRFDKNYIKEKWKDFKDRFYDLLEEKYRAILEELLVDYIQQRVKSFSKPIVPFKSISRDFGLTFDEVEELLIRLINTGRLSGKIISAYKVYSEYNGELRVDKEIIEYWQDEESLNPILYDWKKIAKQWAPILSLLGSILTIIFNALRLSSAISPILIGAIIVIILLGSLVVIYLKRGKKEKYTSI